MKKEVEITDAEEVLCGCLVAKVNGNDAEINICFDLCRPCILDNKLGGQIIMAALYQT